MLPHVGKGYPLLDRVRVYVTDGMELVVTASDRYTLGLASVEVLDTTGELRENYTVDGDVAHGHLNPASPFMSVSGDYMSRFATVAKVQGCALVIEPVGRARTLLITCGPDFIGALMPVRQDEEKIEEYRGHRSAWSERFPAVAQVHPVPPKLPNRAEPSPTVIYLSQFDATIANEPDGDDDGAETVVEPETAIDGEIESYLLPIDDLDLDVAERQALQFIAETGSASRKALQKHLRVRVTTVAELLSKIEQAGLIGPTPIDNTPREVFVELVDGVVVRKGGESR